jgi:phosphatidylglycerophosphatase A
MSATGERESSGNAALPAASLPVTARKPRFAIFIATACGLGYLPKAPGTWGSLAGVFIYFLTQKYFPLDVVPQFRPPGPGLQAGWATMIELPITIVIAVVGVGVSSRVATFSGKKDPQFVVIDEVSGQHLTYLLALAPLNWKYLLLGLILFRVFDIWKPFPARQAESLSGGWGIMADDWIAGIYAAIGLWIARAAGL